MRNIKLLQANMPYNVTMLAHNLIGDQRQMNYSSGRFKLRRHNYHLCSKSESALNFTSYFVNFQLFASLHIFNNNHIAISPFARFSLYTKR